MLVRGLSGSGKTYLAEALRRDHASALPAAMIDLRGVARIEDALHRIAQQLEVGPVFRATVNALRADEQCRPFVQSSPTMTIEATRESSVQGVAQTTSILIDGLADLIAAEATRYRVDAFLDALGPRAALPWILFVDEAERFSESPERAALLDLLVTLRERAPGVRLYLTGQEVPSDRFDAGDRIERTLGALDVAAITALLRQEGIDDAELARRILADTGGHPILVGMEIDLRSDANSDADASPVDSDRRTRWIYERLVARMPSPSARRIAPHLALLEWFDLGLLRRVFEAEVIDDAAFRVLVERAFIRRLGDGRYACHDAITLALRDRLWSEDPDRCRAVLEAAFRAFTERIAAEERATGELAFPRRADLRRGALRSAIGFDRQRALAYAEVELGIAICTLDSDQLFVLGREFQASQDKQVVALAEAQLDLLAEMGVGRFTRASADLLAQLACACTVAGRDGLADLLTSCACRLFEAAGLPERAAALADSAWHSRKLSIHAGSRIQARLALRDLDEARVVLAEARAALPDDHELRLAEARVLAAAGDVEAAVAALVPSLDDGATAVQARRLRARLLFEAGHGDSAMSEINAGLAVAPNDIELLDLQSDLLVERGDFSRATQMTAQHPALSNRAAGGARRVMLLFQDRAQRLAALGELERMSPAAPLAVRVQLALAFALHGEVAETDLMVAAIVAEAPILCPQMVGIQALARNAAGRHDEAAALASGLLEAGLRLPVAYEQAFMAYRALNRHDEAIAVAAQMAEHLPGYLVLASAWQLLAIGERDGINAVEAERAAMPPSLRSAGSVAWSYARALLAAKRNAQALDVIDTLVHTKGADDLTRSELLALRTQYAALLVDAGRTAEAREAARDLYLLAPEDPELVGAHAEILAKLRDEAALLAFADEVAHEHRWIVIDVLGRMVLQTRGSVDALRAEVMGNPNRPDLVFAFVMACRSAGRESEVSQLAAMIGSDRFAKGMDFVRDLVRDFERSASPMRLAQFRAFHETDPHELLTALSVIEMMRQTATPDETIEFVDEALRRAPEHTVPLTRAKIHVLLDAGRVDEAERQVAKYLAGKVPPSVLDPIELHIAVAQRDYDRAVAICDRGELGKLEAITVLIRAERYADAEARLETIVADGIEEREAVAFHHALVLINTDRARAALAKLTSRQASPDWRGRHAGLVGDAHRALGEMDAAIAAYTEACACADALVVDRLSLVELLTARGDLDAAAAQLAEVDAIAPAAAATFRRRHAAAPE